MAIATPASETPQPSKKKPTAKRRRRKKRPAPAKQEETSDVAATLVAGSTSSAAAPSKGTGTGGRTAGRTAKRRAQRKRKALRKAEASKAGAEPEPAPAKADTTAEPTKTTPKARKRRKKKKAATTSDAQPAAPTTAAAEPKPTAPVSEARREAQKPAAAKPAPVKAKLLPADTAAPRKTGREMIINVTGDDECRIAILHNGRLEELFIERRSAESHVGNIYKGRVTNVEPSIQAAFVDFGFPKNGFLHVSDVQPQYFPTSNGRAEAVGKKVPRRDRPPIQRCFRRGQEVIVQITKEGVGTKGPTLTTYLSIAGRFLVLMPGMDRLGVSRKIEDEEARRKMRELLNQLSFPEKMGFILRTAGLGQSKRELQRDLNYLARLWRSVRKRIESTSPPAELYQESDLVIRTLRDVYTSDFDRVVADNAETADKAHEFLQIAAPRSSRVAEFYDDPKPIFHAFGIEQQIELINSRHVPLPSGGTLVIDTTEAMVAIDVNSGTFRAVDDAEEAAFKINMEAAEEVARQLRLRDLGGLIVCDFIDMRYDRHKRAVEKALRDALRIHKERARILRMSQFGLIEMTRQRQRPSIKRSLFADCPHCRGSGLVKTIESMSLEVMRILQLAAHRKDVHRITLTAAPEVALMVLNERRATLHQLQESTGRALSIQADSRFGPDEIECICEDPRGRPVNFTA